MRLDYNLLVILFVYDRILDHLKNLLPQPRWVGDTSYGQSWGGDTSYGQSWGGDTSYGQRGGEILHMIPGTTLAVA